MHYWRTALNHSDCESVYHSEIFPSSTVLGRIAFSEQPTNDAVDHIFNRTLRYQPVTFQRNISRKSSPGVAFLRHKLPSARIPDVTTTDSTRGAHSGIVTTMKKPDRYTHGHHQSVLRSHQWRTAQNSAAFLLPHLAPSMSLLDVGCGPGTVSLDLAHWLPTGQVTGIDLSADVIDIARETQRTSDVVNVTFEVGNVYDLTYGDGSFDVVYAHQVLQHLSDPIDALGQMRRVVRNGGIVALRESDFGGFTWSPDNQMLDRWMEIYQALTRRNSVDANAGRHLHAWVRKAGFSSFEVSSSNWTFYRPEERAWWGGLWADRVRESEFARQSVEYGLTTQEELQEIAEGFLAWANDVDGIFTLVNTEVLARK